MSDLRNMMMADVVTAPMRTKPPGRQTKTGRLKALGWSLVPIPLFVEARELWHDPNTDEGNEPCISFMLGKQWLVIPPEEVGPAFRVTGKVTAIQVAWRLALEASPGTTYGPPQSPLRVALNEISGKSLARPPVPASDALQPKMQRSNWLDRAREEHQAFDTAIRLLELYQCDLSGIADEHGDGLREFSDRMADMKDRYMQAVKIVQAVQRRLGEFLP